MSTGRDRSVVGNGAADVATRFPALPVGRHHLPPDFVKRYQKERLVAATAAVVHEGGLGNLTVTQIFKTAGVSNKTFYEFFANKEECLSFAYEAGFEHLFGPVEAAYAGPGSWKERLGVALAALLDGMAEEPALAELCLAHSGGRIGQRSRAQAVEVLAQMLRDGRAVAEGDGRNAPALSEEVLAPGILALLSERSGDDETGDPEELVGELVEIAVALLFRTESAEREELEAGAAA